MAAFGRIKKMPELKSIMRKLSGEKPKKQSTKEMLKMAETITAMMGGEDLRKKK